MEAFPRRSSRVDTRAHLQSAALPVLSPLQVQDLFAARLEEICAGFEAWHYPLVVGGKLGAAVPGFERDALQLSLTDASFGTVLAIDIRTVAFETSGIVAGDDVRVSGFLRARGQRGQAVLRFEAIAIERCDFSRDLAVQSEKKLLDIMRYLPAKRNVYPSLNAFSMVVMYPAAERDAALAAFCAALGSGVQADQSRFLPLEPDSLPRLLAAIESSREAVLVILGGERSFPAVWFDDAALLDVLANAKAHRILVQGHGDGHGFAARFVDYSALEAEEAGRYIRNHNVRLWRAQEEQRAQMEEITALREGVESLSTIAPAWSWQRRIGLACAVFVSGVIFALLLSSFK